MSGENGDASNKNSNRLNDFPSDKDFFKVN